TRRDDPRFATSSGGNTYTALLTTTTVWLFCSMICRMTPSEVMGTSACAAGWGVGASGVATTGAVVGTTATTFACAAGAGAARLGVGAAAVWAGVAFRQLL